MSFWKQFREYGQFISCTRKIRYGHEETARQARSKMAGKGVQGLEIYHRTNCDGYHLGHPKGTQDLSTRGSVQGSDCRSLSWEETGRMEGEMPDKVTDTYGRVWLFDNSLEMIPLAGTNGVRIVLGGKWTHNGQEASSAPDHDRARREGTLRGDPLIAGAWCNYPKGEIIDYFCLACGSSFAAHDDDSSCWRLLKTEAELQEYDDAMDIADRIRHEGSR